MKEELIKVNNNQITINIGFAARSNNTLSNFEEFVDNIIPLARKMKLQNKKGKISITINRLDDVYWEVIIEDNAGGVSSIPKCLLEIDSSKNGNSFESYYSFGIKQSSCALSKNGGSWEIYSRTEEMINEGKFIYVKGPYDLLKYKQYKLEVGKDIDENGDKIRWSGRFNEAGTVFKFKINEIVLRKILKTHEIDDISNPTNNMQLSIFDESNEVKIIKVLREELGYIYERYLVEDLLRISIVNKTNTYEVTPISISWKEIFYDEVEKCDFGGGIVDVKLKIGHINNSKDTIYRNKVDANNNGLVIIVNGRKMQSPLWIWKDKQDPHNHPFVIEVCMTSNNIESLPAPLVDKTHLSSDDEKYWRLIEFIKMKIPKPIRDDYNSKQIEKEAKKQLMKELVKRESLVFSEYKLCTFLSEANGSVDIREVTHKNIVNFYELKVEHINKGAIEQVLRYISLAKIDGEKVNKVILVGDYYTGGIQEYVNQYNLKIDDVHLELKIWSDYNIDINSIKEMQKKVTSVKQIITKYNR